MLMPMPDTPLGRLLDGPMRAGQLAWIGVRPERKAPMLIQSAAALIAGCGIEGDHYDTERNGPRQVTIIAIEDIVAIEAFLGKNAVEPELLRRNLVTRGINLIALKARRFRIGSALLETSGECAPCSRMEADLGPGGYNAMRGRGGITARVVKSGTVQLGDIVERVA